jgi:hypothetical protein
VTPRPLLLDLFCGLGGSAVGYHRAGFTVVGVDIKPQPDYPFEFHQRNALEVLAEARHWRYRPAAVHASPPCQGSSAPTKGTNAKRNAENGLAHPMLIEDTRAAFEAIGIPYVIENVQGSAVRRDLTLCGEMFGLRVIRHRYFELGGWMMLHPSHVPHRGYVRGWRHGIWRDGPYLAVYGKGGGKATVEECREGLGIDWSWDRDQLVEAIPPAMTELIGAELFNLIRR